MNATNRYLNRLIELKGFRSDYALSKFLGVSTASVSIWRSESSQLGDDMAFRIAHELGIPAIEIIAEIGAERAKVPATRQGWRDMLDQFRASHVVPVFFVAILAAVLAGNHVRDTRQGVELAGDYSPTLSQVIEKPVNIMSNSGGGDGQHFDAISDAYVTPVTAPTFWIGAVALMLLLLCRRRGGHSIGG